MIVEMDWISQTPKATGEKKGAHESRYGPNWEAQQDKRPGTMGGALPQMESRGSAANECWEGDDHLLIPSET